MLYEEYIQIRNFMRLHNFYGLHKIYSDDTDIWKQRAMHLITDMCELEDKNLYPKSSILDDLIEFTQQNPDAARLRRYLDELPGQWDLGNKSMSLETYKAHGFLTHCLYDITHHMSETYTKCSIDMNGIFKFKCKCNEFGNYRYLEVVINEKVINIENVGHRYNDHHFLINGILEENLELHKLINLISCAKYVKKINVENTQAAYYFLR